MKDLGLSGLVARFKPLHNGGALMLEYVCKRSEHVKIGLGSSNRYNVRNPFTVAETKEMVSLYLRDIGIKNYEFIEVPDFAHDQRYQDGKKWKEYVNEKFTGIDNFITGNEWVRKLLGQDFKIIHPARLIPKEKWIKIRATMVRLAMAQGDDYGQMIPDVITSYLQNNGLVQRFRDEFGLQTIVMMDGYELEREDVIAEQDNVIRY